MTRDYLTAREKQSIAYLSASIVALDDAMNNVGGSMPRAVSGDFKRAQYFLGHGLETWTAGVDPKVKRSIVNIVKDSTLGVVDKRTGKSDVEAHERYLYGKEHLMDAAEDLLSLKCAKCDGTPRDGCRTYQFYRHFELPELDPTHPNCPYSLMDLRREEADSIDT